MDDDDLDAAAAAVVDAIGAGRLDAWLVRLSSAIKLRREAINRRRLDTPPTSA